MPLLFSQLPDRFFSRRRGRGASSPAPSDSGSSTSSASRSSASPVRIQTLLTEVKNVFSSSPAFELRRLDGYVSGSFFGAAVDEAIRCLSPLSDAPSRNLSPWEYDWPHDCECKSRSTCPEFLQQHLSYLQTHEWHCLPGVLLPAYYITANEYSRTRSALPLPAAKLARAKAEYDWVMSRMDGNRLWAPRLQRQLEVAQEKISAAEGEWEVASLKRWERAQLLMEIGRF